MQMVRRFLIKRCVNSTGRALVAKQAVRYFNDFAEHVKAAQQRPERRRLRALSKYIEYYDFSTLLAYSAIQKVVQEGDKPIRL